MTYINTSSIHMRGCGTRTQKKDKEALIRQDLVAQSIFARREASKTSYMRIIPWLPSVSRCGHSDVHVDIGACLCLITYGVFLFCDEAEKKRRPWP